MRVVRFGLLISEIVILFLSSCNRLSNEYLVPVSGGGSGDAAQPTEGPSPVPTDPPFLGFPSPTPKAYKTKLEVNLPNLSGTFFVRADTPLTISDLGTDGTTNECKISSSGNVVSTQQVPVGQASGAFSLARGTYKMNCGRQNADATIISE